MAIEQDQILKINHAVLALHRGASVAIEEALHARPADRRRPYLLIQPNKQIISVQQGIQHRRGGVFFK
jgi:hypothetical protein